jgi:hypothetical protein
VVGLYGARRADAIVWHSSHHQPCTPVQGDDSGPSVSRPDDAASRASRGPAVARRTPASTWRKPIEWQGVLRIVRYVWASPTTAVGLLLLLLAKGRSQARVVDGVVEADGPALAWLLTHFTVVPGGAAALTLGHVVIARDPHALALTRAHERVHVRQCEVWGPLFVPAYLAAGLWALLRGRHFYFDNQFEIEAFQRDRSWHEAPGPARVHDPR